MSDLKARTNLSALLGLRGPIALLLAGLGALAIGDLFACVVLLVASYAWTQQIRALWQEQLACLTAGADALDLAHLRLSYAAEQLQDYARQILAERASAQAHASIGYDRGYADAIDHVNETLENRGSRLRVEDHRTHEAPN